MKYTNLGEFSTIKEYIAHRHKLLEKCKTNFEDIFKLMFYDESNVLFEESDGYRIRKITYGESKKRVDLIARNIKKKLVRSDDQTSIAIYLDNSATWIETFWAILKCGYRPLLLNMRLDDASLVYAMEITNTKLVISKGKIFSIPTLLESEIYRPCEKEVTGPFGEQFLVMSSGTSKNIKICAYGAKEMKGILIQSKGIIASSELVQKHYEGELKLLAFLPFYHIFGFVAVYAWFAFYGRTFVKLNDYSPSTIQNTIKRHKVTHVFAVPLFWQKTYEAAIKEIKSRGEKTYKKFLKGLKLAQNPVFGKYITKHAFKEVREGLFGDSISYMISGGSHIDKEILNFFNAIGYHLSNGYGMSEVGITSVELSEDLKYLNSGSVGRPLFGVTYDINKDGVLQVRNIAQACMIFEAGRVNRVDGMSYNTKDLAKVIDGKFYILGREDDLVVSLTGENLNPNIIEENLKVDDINDLCLINGEDERELPILLVSINKFIKAEKANQILDNLKAKIKENNLTSQLGKIELIAEPFIRGDDFKKNRKDLAKDYFAGVLSLYSFEMNEKEVDDELTLGLKKLFAVALGKAVEDIHSEADFFADEGGSSLDYFALVGRINDEYGVNLGESEKPLNSVKDIAQFIREHS